MSRNNRFKVQSSRFKVIEDQFAGAVFGFVLPLFEKEGKGRFERFKWLSETVQANR
jgi:hypothetical protein